MSAEVLIPTGQAESTGFDEELRKVALTVVETGALPDEVIDQGLSIEPDPSSPDGVRVVERPPATARPQ